MTREEVVAAARQSIERGSKSFRAASRLFDPATRERAWLLYCWCRHCDDVADGQIYGFGGGVRGNISLLRDNTRRAINGKPSDEVAFQALAQLFAERPLPGRLLEDHLDGFALDETGWHPVSEEDLLRYCYHVAGSVGCMMAIVMGVPADDADTLERAADLGIAFQLSNIARDIREDFDNGRCYLPDEWLAGFGVRREELIAPHNRPALLSMIDRLVKTIAVYEASARKGVPRLPFRSRVAVLTALRIYGAIGRKVAQVGSAAWDRRVAISKARKLAYLVPSVAEASFGRAALR